MNLSIPIYFYKQATFRQNSHGDIIHKSDITQDKSPGFHLLLGFHSPNFLFGLSSSGLCPRRPTCGYTLWRDDKGQIYTPAAGGVKILRLRAIYEVPASRKHREALIK